MNGWQNVFGRCMQCWYMHVHGHNQSVLGDSDSICDFFCVVMLLFYRVCYQQSSYITTYVAYYQQLTYASQYYTVSCGFFGWSRCSRYRLVSSYSSAPQTNYRMEYRSIQICCSGYNGTSPYNCQRKCCECIISYMYNLLNIEYLLVL